MERRRLVGSGTAAVIGALADAMVSDLTVCDVHVVGHGANARTIRVNADGLQMRGCTATGPVSFSRSSRRSLRPTVVGGCSFTYRDPSE